MTDNLFQNDASLRYSIAVVVAIALPLAAIILTLGFKGYAKELARMSPD